MTDRTRSAAIDLATVAQSAPSESDAASSTLEILSRVIAFDVAFWVRGARIGAGSIGLDARSLARADGALSRWGRELAPVVMAARAQHSVAVDVEVLGAAALAQTSVYREIMAPARGRQTMLVPLEVRGESVGLLALGRTDVVAFSARERAALTSLRAILSLAELSLSRLARLPAELTRRERDVLECLQRGLTNREIALVCGSSINTIKKQVRSLFEKLGATTRAEAVGLSLGST